MNKRQMYRLVCLYNARYLFGGSQSNSLTDLLSEADMERFYEAQDRLIDNLQRQAGVKSFPSDERDMIAAVKGPDQ